jgi:diguanylate cyclase (GGDEF)-like protein
MRSQPHGISGNLESVVTHPSHPEINQETRNRFAAKVLALSGILQTTLEINELMALFAKEIRQIVEYNGLTYNFPSLKIDISLGDQPQHSCSYQLLVAGDHLGDLQFYRTHRFDNEELEIIENLLAALLYPLRNTLLYQRAIESASTDPLTGVRNRISMESAIRREIGLARRHKTPLSMILFDIDHFKSINDTLGHLSGDQAIKKVARCAEESIRESDLVFRYGGEEFLVLLSGTDLKGAELLAERIRTNVESLRPFEKNDRRVTVSLGVASLQESDEVDSMIQRMDEALYRAKELGRNRTVLTA